MPLAVLAVLVAVLAVSAYYPFRWDPPRMVANQVTRTATGPLRFGDMNSAQTPGTPSWLPQVRLSGAVTVRLVAETATLQQSSASIMMLASDFWHTDFAIAQDGGDLQVWLRHPGTNANGDPPARVAAVFRPGRWATVELVLSRSGLRIVVDGRTRLTEHLPADSARVWGPGVIVLGDEVHHGGPWQGEIRQAEVSAGGHLVDYLRPGALAIPAHFLYLPDHVAPFPPPSLREWLVLMLHLLTFIPVGFVIAAARRPLIRPVPAALLAAGLALVLAAGKFLFHDRHMAAADIVLQTSGALLGALLAARLARRPWWQRPRWPLSPRPGTGQQSGAASSRR